MPDCGYIVKLIGSVTNVRLKFMGKPYKVAIDYFLNKVNFLGYILAILMALTFIAWQIIEWFLTIFGLMMKI